MKRCKVILLMICLTVFFIVTVFFICINTEKGISWRLAVVETSDTAIKSSIHFFESDEEYGLKESRIMSIDKAEVNIYERYLESCGEYLYYVPSGTVGRYEEKSVYEFNTYNGRTQEYYTGESLITDYCADDNYIYTVNTKVKEKADDTKTEEVQSIISRIDKKNSTIKKKEIDNIVINKVYCKGGLIILSGIGYTKELTLQSYIYMLNEKNMDIERVVNVSMAAGSIDDIKMLDGKYYMTLLTENSAGGERAAESVISMKLYPEQIKGNYRKESELSAEIPILDIEDLMKSERMLVTDKKLQTKVTKCSIEKILLSRKSLILDYKDNLIFVKLSDIFSDKTEAVLYNPKTNQTKKGSFLNGAVTAAVLDRYLCILYNDKLLMYDIENNFKYTYNVNIKKNIEENDIFSCVILKK